MIPPDILDLWERGLSLIPLRPGDKRPACQWKEFQRRRATLDELEGWFGGAMEYNVGIVTGAVSGIIVTDCDSPDAIAWADEHLPPTRMATRTAKGEHRFYGHPGSRISNTVRLHTGEARVEIDVRADGGYVVGPGSVHKTGARYEKVGDWPPIEELLVFDSAWLDPAAAKTRHPTVTRSSRPGDGSLPTKSFVPEGERNDTLFREGCRLRRQGADLQGIIGALRASNQRWCTPPLDRSEVGRIASSCLSYDVAQGSFPTNEAGDAELVLNRTDPITSARVFLSRHYTVDDTLTLRHQQGVFYWWEPAVNAFREYDENTVKAELWRFLERAFRWTTGKVSSRVPFQPQRARVDDVFAALCAVTNLSPSTDPPCWLDRDMGLEPSKLLAFSNGTLDVRTRVLHPKTPCFYTHNAVTFEYDAHPPEPTEFHRFLKSLWTDEGSGVIDEQSIATLQECFGYLLVGATRLQKIFMIIGPKRSGKGTIGRVLRQLLGQRNVCAPSLTSLGRSFGGQVLIDTTLAIISDARLKGRDTAVIVEELLSISGEDAKTISRKYLPDWTGMLKTQFLLLTNELPGIEDESGALASRFIVVALRNSFYKREDPRLFDRLEPELPGILAWALDGWDRLNSRGYFVSPVASAGLIRQFEELNSPVGAFLDEGCEVGPQYDEAQRDVFSAWSLWCADNGRDRPGTAQSFGRYLRSCLPQVPVIRVQKEGLRRWYWQGLRLTDQGRRAAGMGERQEQVNLRM